MKVLELQLKLKEPVLVSRPGIDPNTDESLNYLPGSVIRGALASQFARAWSEKGQWEPGKHELFKRLFLGGDVRFLNAYLARKEVRLLPTPNHWAVEKDPPDPANQWKVIDLSQPMPDELKQTKSLGGGFHRIEVEEQKKIVYTPNVTFETAVHNARNRKMGRAVRDDETNRSALFRYRALAKGQTFITRIVFNNGDDEAHLKPYLKDTIWLGRSSSAGYGRTQIAACREAALKREVSWQYQDITAYTPFFVYFTSDAILRHPETGQAGAYLMEMLNAHYPKHNFTFAEDTEGDPLVFSKMGWVGGFNVKWGLPLPQTWAVLKGSVWVLQCDQDLTAQTIQSWEETGFGERLAEGFGSIVIAPQKDWPTELFLPQPRPPELGKVEADLEFDDLKEDAAFLQEMNKRIVEQELDRHLAVALNKLDIRKIRLSNSQLVRLRLNVRKQGGAGEPHFAVFRRYLDGTEKRKSADDQFRKSRIRHDPLRQWLLNLVEKPAKTWDVIGLQNYGWVLKEGQWQRRLLGEAVYQLDEGLAINYTVRLIDGLCERVQKERK